jgi:hypothetical protein
LTISWEQYTFDSGNTENYHAVNQLQMMLKNESIDSFATELRRLEDPTHVYKDWLEKLEVKKKKKKN